jgi:hypothetical protein
MLKSSTRFLAVPTNKFISKYGLEHKNS